MRKVRRTLEASYFAFFTWASLEKQSKTFSFFFKIKCFSEIHEKQSGKWGISIFGSDFLYLSSHTDMQFPQIREKTLCSLAEPSPTCFWGNLVISLARKLSRQQEEKRPERAKKRVFKGRIYKGNVSLQQPGQKKKQTVVDLHLIAAAGWADVFPLNAKGVAPAPALVGGWVGNEDRLVFQFLSAAIPVAGMQPIFHDTKWDGQLLKIPKKFHTPR